MHGSSELRAAALQPKASYKASHKAYSPTAAAWPLLCTGVAKLLRNFWYFVHGSGSRSGSGSGSGSGSSSDDPGFHSSGFRWQNAL